MKVSRIRTSLALLMVAVLTGCVSLTKPPAPAVVIVEPPRSYPPIVSDRFLLETPDQQVVGELQVIEARYEDTFVDIARAYNVGFDELIEANPGVDAWLPGEGTRILLPTRYILPDAPYEGIVINLARKRLFYFPEPDADGRRVVVTYPLGIGKEGTVTPVGATTVISKTANPVWWPPQSVREEHIAKGDPLPEKVLPGPDNPLGAHALRLGMPSYLIHGTNKPAGVGMRSSHGCLRLFPENIAFMYDDVPVGTSVAIVNQPWLFGWQDGHLYLEAHKPFSDDTRDQTKLFAEQLAAALEAAPNGMALVADDRLLSIQQEALGVPLPLLQGEPSPVEVVAAARFVNNLVAFPESNPELVAQQITE
jgi:L,D-transpeptidase ErfK/SrfK